MCASDKSSTAAGHSNGPRTAQTVMGLRLSRLQVLSADHVMRSRVRYHHDDDHVRWQLAGVAVAGAVGCAGGPVGCLLVSYQDLPALRA